MPRLPRIYIEGSIYYITSVGNHGENIFRDQGDYQMYLELLKKYKELHGFKLFSFVLMPNQVNLLIEIKEGATISVIMHDVASSYTKYFNKRYQRKGHLFQERFKSAVVEKKPYLLDLVSYTHLSPQRLGLVKDASECAYSSHLLYLYMNQSPTEPAARIKKIIDLEGEIQEVLKLITEVYPHLKGYSEFMAGVNKEEIEGLKKKLHRTAVLGSAQFMEQIKSQLESRTQEYAEEKGKKFPFVPVASASLVVLLSAAGIWFWYGQKNMALRQKEMYERLQREPERPGAITEETEKEIYEKIKKELEGQMLLTGLDGTQWTIELKSQSNLGTGSLHSDRIIFKDGAVSSNESLRKGFSTSHYTMTVQDDGMIIWETMQTASDGTTASWRGEIKQGKMEGILSLREKGKEPQDFSFISKPR